MSSKIIFLIVIIVLIIIIIGFVIIINKNMADKIKKQAQKTDKRLVNKNLTNSYTDPINQPTLLGEFVLKIGDEVKVEHLTLKFEKKESYGSGDQELAIFKAGLDTHPGEREISLLIPNIDDKIEHNPEALFDPYVITLLSIEDFSAATLKIKVERAIFAE